MALSSLLNNALSSVATSSATEIAGSLLLAGQGRSIMGLFADVTIEEKHKDEVQITEHPTEVGAAITDHAFKETPEVSMKVGWSESAGKLNGFVGDSILSGTVSLIAVYEALQQLQNNAILLIVSTGKRLYTNMLIKSLSCTTDMTTENVLMIDITFKNVILVKTSETTVLIENQADPSKTASVQNGGTVQAKEVNSSYLKTGADFVTQALFGG
ncbi:phage baseplate protein [Acinetobacter baumannii]